MAINTANIADLLRPGLEKVFKVDKRAWMKAFPPFDEDWLKRYRRERRLAKQERARANPAL
jgi:hypothetical protein